MRRFVAVLVLALVGCGGGSDPGGGGGSGGSTYQPTVHPLANSLGESIPAGDQVAIGPFTVPSNATASYSILDTPTGIGSDTMDVGVVTDASVNTTAPVGYGIQKNVSSTSGTTQPLPAGTYDLLVQCFNLADNCILQATLSATY